MIWKSFGFKEIQPWQGYCNTLLSNTHLLTKSTQSLKFMNLSWDSVLYCWKHAIYFTKIIPFGVLIFCPSKEKFVINYKSSHKWVYPTPQPTSDTLQSASVNRPVFAHFGSISTWNINGKKQHRLGPHPCSFIVSNPRQGLKVCITMAGSHCY